MPTNTYTPLASITLASSAFSVTFSSISQNYSDLILVTRHDHSGNYGLAGMRFNSDSATNYSNIVASGLSWAGTNSGSSSGTTVATINVTGNGPGSYIASTTSILDYSATNKHKSVITRVSGFSGSDTWTSLQTNRWSSDTAITSITIGNWSGTYTQGFAAGSSFELYGVLA